MYKKLFKNRTAQVTFFIIIAVLSLLSIVAVVYISNLDFSSNNVNVSSNNVVLQQCISEQFENSLRVASLKGGYVDFNNVPYFVPFNSYKMPLWKKDNTLFIPDAESIEQQLSSDLKNRIIEYCVSDDVKSVLKNKLNVKVLLSEDENRAVVKFNTYKQEKNSVKNFGVYEVKNSVPFLKMLNTAKNFYSDLESKDVLKDLTTTIIAMNKNIPTEGLSFDCEKKVWDVETVKKAFFKSLKDISPKVSFNGVPKYDNEIVKKHFTYNLDSVKNSNVKVKMIFKENYNNSFFKVDNVEGNLMTSFVTKNAVGCQNSYSFYYDYSVPVIFSLYDENEDYYFRFALPIEVYRNNVDVDPESKIESSNEVIVENTVDENNNEVEVKRTVLNDFCSKTTYEKINLSIKDNFDNPVSKVVSYIQCGSQQCYLDVVDNYVYSSLPSNCAFGKIYVSKKGYSLETLNYKFNKFSDLKNKDVVLYKLYNFILKEECNGVCDFENFNFVVFNNKDNVETPVFLSKNDDFASVKPKDGKIVFAIVKTTPSGFNFVEKKSFSLEDFDKGTDYYIKVVGKPREEGFYTFEDISFEPVNSENNGENIN